MILTRSLLSSSCPNEVSATQACACIKHVIGFPSSAGTRITTRAFFGAHSPRSDTTEVEQISISAISIVLAPCIADGALCSESNTQGSDRHHKERDSPARPFGPRSAPAAWRCWRRCAAAYAKACWSHTERRRPTLLPRLFATRCPQQKIFQDKFALASRKRPTANSACDFAVSALRSGFGSDDLIKRLAVWALEKRFCRESSHE